MSPRITVSLSRIAILALTASMLGVALALYGRVKEVDWATQAGTFLLFGGAILYIIERLRSSRQRYEDSE